MTIKERASIAIGKKFTVIDLEPDIARLIATVLAEEFGDQEAYDPETHITISIEAAEWAKFACWLATRTGGDGIKEDDGYKKAENELGEGLNS